MKTIFSTMNTANQTILNIPKEDVGKSSLDEESGSVTSSASSTSFEYIPTKADCSNKTHCWMEPQAENFYVRGPNYLRDKRKVRSSPYLLPLRGAELFLTEESPENIGRSNAVLQGKLRTTPTFVVNFRFPWGLLVLSFEIPIKFLPFLHCRYSKNYHAEKNKLEQELNELSPSERTLARFLMNDDKQKQSSLKLIPMVIEGPWIVKSIIAGKPVIIGNKLPTSFFFDAGDRSKGIAEYLEFDLDIGNSSKKAKSIVSTCKTYMKSITVDIGFVIQGNASDELPEQMLGSARLHQFDAAKAKIFPSL